MGSLVMDDGVMSDESDGHHHTLLVTGIGGFHGLRSVWLFVIRHSDPVRRDTLSCQLLLLCVILDACACACACTCVHV